MQCPRQIVVNCYSLHSKALYLFSGVALYGQRMEIRHYILPFLSSGYEHDLFCLDVGPCDSFSPINQIVKTILQRGMESV